MTTRSTMIPSLFKKSDFKAKYELKEQLGKGNFAEVRLAINKETQDEVAVKILDVQDDQDYGYIKKEIEILGKLQHPNIVRLIEIFEVNSTTFTRKKTKKVLIVMELVTGGEMFARIVKRRVFSEVDARSYIRTILEALEYMHRHGVVHRDLKPENILLLDERDDSPIKIADFGLSQLYDPDEGHDERLYTMCGTPGYVAPEILKKRGYGPQVDVWATGVIMHILLSGSPPFYDDNRDKLFRKIVKGKITMKGEAWAAISDEAKDLLSKLLMTNPDQRLTPVTALEHEWFAAEAISTNSLSSTVGLKEYHEQRKAEKQWRVLRMGLLAANRLQSVAADSARKSLKSASEKLLNFNFTDTDSEAPQTERGTGPTTSAANGDAAPAK